MRHQRNSRRFGLKPAHRLAMFKNMVTSLFLSERILITLERAKELRRLAEKLITLGKRGDLAARRLAARRLCVTGRKVGGRMVYEETALRKLFDALGPRFEKRPGGYTRIIRTGQRRGDGAAMAFLEILPEEKKAGGKKVKGGQKRSSADKSGDAKKKAAPKKAASKKAAPKKAAPRKAAPKKTAAKKTGGKKAPRAKKSEE
ncbi:MAG TPA: 50S ribosomal protein L17 [Myxococcota bacterium]|nr:50S ribosomal protein L17 [Myxococcota bacterium]